MGIALALSVSFAHTFAPKTGHAQAMDLAGETQRHHAATAMHLRVSGEVAYTKRSGLRDEVLMWSPVLAARYRLYPCIDVEGMWGGVMLVDKGRDGTSASTFGSSNLIGGVRYWIENDSEQSISLSADLVAPLAWLGRDALAGQRRAGFGLAAASRGLWNPWLWAPEQTGGALGAVYARRFSSELRSLVEAGLGTTFSLGTATADVAEVYGQLAGELVLSAEGAEGAEGVDFGMRVQGVWMTADRAAMQLSLTPYMAVRVFETVVRGQFIVNLDEPLGVIGDGLHVWAVLLSVEARL